MPAWHLYEELFDDDDVVYLELDGVQADVVMIRGSLAVTTPGTVLIRLPTVTARQLGLLPPEWSRDTSWSKN
nr:hypothetical protein [Caballeronia sp. ATUFL_F2_KS9A]